MKAWLALGVFLFAGAAASASTTETVKFTPTVRLYECPPGFVYRSDCAVHEKKLDPQVLALNLEVLTDRMGQWSLQMKDPIPASYFVIVVRGRSGDHYDYSVSAETGLPGSAAPFAEDRVEFSDAAIPKSFGVASAPMEKDGKKYLTEIRLGDFHGKPVPPAKK
jgi:hypothetical protein